MNKKQISIILAVLLFFSVTSMIASADASTDYIHENFNSYAGENKWTTTGGTWSTQELITSDNATALLTRGYGAGIGDKADGDISLKFTAEAYDGAREASFGQYGGTRLDWTNYNDSTPISVEYNIYDASTTGTVTFRCHSGGNVDSENIYAEHWSFQNVELSKNEWHKVGLEFHQSPYSVDLYIDGKLKNSYSNSSAFYARYPYLALNFPAGATGFIAVDDFRIFSGEYDGKVVEKSTCLIEEDFNTYAGQNTWITKGIWENQQLIGEGTSTVSRDYKDGFSGKESDDRALVFEAKNTLSADAKALFGQYKGENKRFDWDAYNADNPLTIEYQLYNNTANGTISLACHAAATVNLGDAYEPGQWEFKNIQLKKDQWNDVAIEFIGARNAKLYINGVLTDVISKSSDFYARYPYVHFDFKAGDTGIMAVDNFKAYNGLYDGVIEEEITSLIEENFNSYTGQNYWITKGIWANQQIIGEGASGVSRDYKDGLAGKNSIDRALIFEAKNPVSSDAKALFGQYKGENKRFDWDAYGTGNPLTVEYQLYNDTASSTITAVCHAVATVNLGDAYEPGQWEFKNIPLVRGQWNDVAIEFAVENGLYAAKLYVNGVIVDKIVKTNAFWARYPYLHLDYKAGDKGIMAIDNFKVYTGEYKNKKTDAPAKILDMYFMNEGIQSGTNSAIIYPINYGKAKSYVINIGFGVYTNDGKRLEQVNYRTIDVVGDNPYILEVNVDNTSGRNLKLFVWDENFEPITNFIETK